MSAEGQQAVFCFENADHLASLLKALGHPARLAILAVLSNQNECCCSEVVNGLPLAQSTVSQHLKVLREAGLIAGQPDGVRSSYRLEIDELRVVHNQLGQFIDHLEETYQNCCKPVDCNAGQNGDKS